MRSNHPIRHCPAVLVALATMLPTALGQNALGDGRQLDNSLSTSTRYNAKRVDPAAEFRFRNAVATGNAPGGLSLRADVGYKSAYEFRGELGSDDLFSFRRDSLYSGLAGMGIRGTDAIQYQFALTTGSRLPQNIVGNAMVLRSGVRSTAAGRPGGVGAVGSSYASPLRRETQNEREESERLTGLLRSPSSYATTRSLRPLYLGTVTSHSQQGHEQGISASALRGVRIIEMKSAGSEQAEQQRVRTAHDTILDSQRVRVQINTSAREQTEENATDSAEDWRSRLDTLREQLLKGINEPEKPSVHKGAGPTDEGAETENPEGSSVPGGLMVPEVQANPADINPGLRFDPETLKILRPDGEVIDSLVDSDSPMDHVYVGHMEAGQYLLASGRYFDAEERFTRALSIRRGDVAAQVGRMHSQLGAGLFVSAGLNLRELVMTSPEIAATRFAAGLLPSEDRAEELLVLLRERAGLVEGYSSRDLLLVREAGLLLAYLSYQRGESETVAVGLGVAQGTLTAEEREITGPDVRMIAYLKELWIPSTSSEPEGE